MYHFSCVGIYAKDVQLITRRSERQARRILKQIRKKLGKENRQLITVAEFCQYMNMKEADVLNMLY